MQCPTISEYVKASQDAGDNLDMSTEATDEELNEAITDEWGVKYSKDGRKLLKAPQNFDGTYSIKKGTKIVCDMAVSGCRFLKSLVLPDSVVNLKGNPFCSWNGELKCLSPYFIYDNKVLFDKDKSKIIAFRDKDTTSYIIPDYVTCIGDSAFNECDSLRSVIIPDGVTSIGDNAFQFCSSLYDLIIPDSVTSIGDWAFYYCSALRSAVLPDGVTSIGIGAFIGCKFLKSLEIPDSVTSIGFGAFSYCYFPYKLKQELISRFGDKIFG